MQLPEMSIRRPVFATVLSLLLVLVGLVSFQRLSVREYPKIDEPVVTVTTRYPGASAEVIESQISKPLEDSIAGIDAVDVITSISRAEQSQISVRFRLEKDPESRLVQAKADQVGNRRHEFGGLYNDLERLGFVEGGYGEYFATAEATYAEEYD